MIWPFRKKKNTCGSCSRYLRAPFTFGDGVGSCTVKMVVASEYDTCDMYNRRTWKKSSSTPVCPHY